VLVHSNHWLSPAALVKLRETGVADSPCSFWRQQRAERLLAPHRMIGLDQVREALSDTAGSPLSICVPPRPSTMTGETATVASFLMRPALGEMQVAMMPSNGADYVSCSLKSDQPAYAESHVADA
jgi:isopenicillin-N N-acyltransferase-like protein